MSDLRKAAELAMLDIERNAHLLGVTQAEQQILGNTPLRTTTAADCYYRLRVRKDELRAHLAAPRPEPTHPGYVIGSHWLETAYSRICAGEAEANVLRDYGLIREEAFTIGVEHLRQENERLREALEKIADSSMSMHFNAAHMAVRLQTIAQDALRREDKA